MNEVILSRRGPRFQIIARKDIDEKAARNSAERIGMPPVGVIETGAKAHSHPSCHVVFDLNPIQLRGLNIQVKSSPDAISLCSE
jgi:hypothetical protein